MNALDADTVIDAAGSTVLPGLIDSHFHVVIGEYQPRQKVVDFIDSYVHGGVTSMISAGEIHTPGPTSGRSWRKSSRYHRSTLFRRVSSYRSQGACGRRSAGAHSF